MRWSMKGGTYDEVKVLLLNWSENDIGLKKPEAGSFVLDETLKLQGIFRDLYRYDTQHYLIPPRNPEARVLQLLLDAFIELSDKQLTKKVLLIICYNGHGTVKDHKLIWSARRDWKLESPDYPALSRYGTTRNSTLSSPPLSFVNY